MLTRSENIWRTRDILDNPQPMSPSPHQMLRQEIAEEQDILNQLNNTGLAWGVESYQLNYTPSQTTYTIGVQDFGKVLYCVKETGNPYIKWVNVPFDDLQYQTYGTILTSFYGVYGSIFPISETPERMSFSRAGILNAQYQVTIQPAPAISWTYQIHYLVGAMGSDDALESAIQLPEFAELVRLRSATALLPYARWGDDEAFNRLKRGELAQSFAYQLARKEDLLKKYITSINVPNTTEVDNWSGY